MTAHDLAGMELLDKIFRIILHHADFFQHDLFFLFDVLWSELGAMQEIGEQVEGLRQVLVEDFHIERGGLARGKRIHLAAQRIDLA